MTLPVQAAASPGTLQIRDGERILTFSYEELLAAHGGEMPGGVALVFRLMQWLFHDAADDIPERRTCSFYSGLGENGKGIIDGAEYVMRVVRGRTLFLDAARCAGKNAPPAPGGGKYYFELGFNQKLYAISVRENVIPREFWDFSRYAHQKRGAGELLLPQERERLRMLREQLATAILAASAGALFSLLEIS